MRELHIYQIIKGSLLPCAEILSEDANCVYMTYLPGETLVEILEAQEAAGKWDTLIWESLVDWLIGFHCHTGYSAVDVNLRNFLYDESAEILYGLDFENCIEEELDITASRLAAFIRTYSPEHTPMKQEIAEYVLKCFEKYLDMPLSRLHQKSLEPEAKLLERRKGRL